MFDGIPTPKQPLTDPELEQAVLALLFADNGNFDKLGTLAPDDFSDPFLGNAFRVALEVRGDGRPVNLVTLKHSLEGMRLPGFDGDGLDALRRLTIAGGLPPLVDIAGRLHALSRRRELTQRLAELATFAADETQPIPSVAAAAIEQLNVHLAEAIDVAHTTFRLEGAAHEFIEWLQSGEPPVEIPTGLKDLDTATGGWHRGEFAILAGRPSMGKSAIALASTLRTALKGHGVLFFSLEMTKRQLVSRALADFSYTKDTPLAYSFLRPGLVGVNEVRRLYDAAKDFADLPIEFETRSGLTVADIIARTRKSEEIFKEQGTPLALVVVDHLLKVRPSPRYRGQPVQEIGEISEGMCHLAKSLDVAVLGLHQLNRGVEGRENPRPFMSDLRGSGSLEQDADVVLLAYRPAYEHERHMEEAPEEMEKIELKLDAVKHDLELQIAKQRNGPTSTLKFFVDMKSNVVRDQEWTL